MSQQPFSRPGAIDLSALKRPAAPPAGGAPATATAGASYWLEVDEASFQATLEASMTAPVLLAFYSPSRLPESEQMARDLATVAEEYEGRFLAGLVDIDVSPAIAQAVQQATAELDAELSRLLALRKVNASISEAEIATVADERAALLAALPQSRLRLDAVRFVVSPDFLALR